MKNLLIILSVLTLLSCNKKPVSVNIISSYKLGNPNLYIDNARLYNVDKNLGDVSIISDGEIESHSFFTIPPGEYTVKWSSFSKNGMGNQLNKIENTEKIIVKEDENKNDFTILGDKLFDKDAYKTYHLEDSTANAEVAKEIDKLETDSIYIIKRTDEMTDKTSYQASRHLNLSEGKNSAEIFFALKMQNNKLVQDNLCIQMNIGGGCVEKNKIIIMFSNGNKMALTCWNDFNCDGNAWFNLSNEQCKQLSTLQVDKIRIQNGRTYDEMTSTLTKQKDYFIQLFYAMNTNKIKDLKK